MSAFGWGTADLVARLTGRAIGPRSSMFGSVTIGSALLSIWVWVAAPPLTWSAAGLAWLAATGIASMASILLLYTAISRGPISVVAPIAASNPLFVVLASLALGLVPTWSQWLAMAVVMIGVVVVARGGRAAARSEPTGAEGLPFTAGLALASAVGFALAVLTAREASAILGELQTVWGTRVISLAALVVFVLASRTRLRLPLRWWPALTLQAVLEVGALFALFVGIAGAGAPLASVAGSPSAIVTALLGRLVLHERIRTEQWAGIAMVAVGVAALAFVSG